MGDRGWQVDDAAGADARLFWPDVAGARGKRSDNGPNIEFKVALSVGDAVSAIESALDQHAGVRVEVSEVAMPTVVSALLIVTRIHRRGTLSRVNTTSRPGSDQSFLVAELSRQ